MAITVHQSPPEYSPLYNGLPYVLSSSNSSAQNFSIQMRVYDGAELLAPLNIPPRPDGYVLADPARIIESTMFPDISVFENVGWRKSGSFAKYSVQFQESFGAVPEVTGAITTSTQYAFNGALRYFDFNAYDMARYLVQVSGTPQNYLTYMPTTVPVRMEQQVELGLFTQQDGLFNPVSRAVIKTYNAAGTQVQQATVDNPFNVYSNDDNRFLSFMCGPADLNSLTLTTGTQPLLNDGIYRYTVQMEDDDGPNASTILQTFVIDRRCSKYENHVVLYFLNPLGRFDSFAFSLANQQSYDYVKQMFRQYAGELDTDTQTFAWNQYGSQRRVFDTTEQEKWTLTADYLEEDVSKWLRDLVGSPRVYMTHPDYDDALVEVQIDKRSHVVNQRAIDRLFNIEMQVSLSAINFRQRL